MFKTGHLAIGALLATMSLSLAFSQPQAAAGLFDRLSPKRKPVAAASKTSETQADKPASSAKRRAGKIALAVYADEGSGTSAIPVGPSPAMPSYPVETVFPVTSTPIEGVDGSDYCFNCGQDDHCQTCLRHCRKQCKQTWYPRAAPYCQPGWGWNQPCWRRTVDNYNCPRPQQLASPRRRSTIPEAPAVEPSMEAPVYEAIPETSPDDSAPE